MNKEKTKLFHKNGVFSLEYDKETLRDMVLEYQEEIVRLNNIIEKLEQENAVLKTQVVNKNKYSYGIRMGSDKE